MLLPVDAYTSQEWFEREQRDLFGKSWGFAGMAEDISEPGEYLCVSIGAWPIIVIRDEQGDLKAYHNICRHRGTQLLEVTGKRKKVIQCPYHDWVYSLDGELIGRSTKAPSIPEHQYARLESFSSGGCRLEGNDLRQSRP